jgi:hypothetical protein
MSRKSEKRRYPFSGLHPSLKVHSSKKGMLDGRTGAGIHWYQWGKTGLGVRE